MAACSCGQADLFARGPDQVEGAEELFGRCNLVRLTGEKVQRNPDHLEVRQAAERFKAALRQLVLPKELPDNLEVGTDWPLEWLLPARRRTRSGACVRTGATDRCCMIPTYERALIVGAGDGLSAAIARALHGAGLRIGLAARNVDKLANLAGDLGAATHPCDVSDPKQVTALFSTMDAALGGAPTLSSTIPAHGCAGPWRNSTRLMSRAPCPSQPMVGFSSRKPQPRGCCRTAMVRFCSRAPRPASRGIRARLRSRWANSRYAGWRRVSPASLRPGHPCGAFRDRRRDPKSGPQRAGDAPTACSTRMRSPGPICTSAAGPQCLDLGGRAEALGRTLLSLRSNALISPGDIGCPPDRLCSIRTGASG